jgi:hypothetical protein
MGSKYDIIFLVPLHKKDERVVRSLASVPKSGNFLSCVITTKKLATWVKSLIKKTDELDIKNIDFIVVDENQTSYPQLVNAGIEHYQSKTNYISVLEYDDVLSDKAQGIISDYIQKFFIIQRTKDKNSLIGQKWSKFC